MSMSKVWLITGSSRGFGRSLAQAVLAAGDTLVATARKPEQLADLAARYGDRVRTVALDVTDMTAARAAVKTAIDAFGRLDVVVNNAGYGNIASIEDVDDADFRAQFETNFFGLVNVTRAALPVLREQGAGHFIQFSSIGGRFGATGLAAYQSAKFAVEGFSDVLSKEVAPFGLKVTLIEPGGFRTEWAGSSMTVGAISAPYQPTIGAFAEFRKLYDGRQPGDPAKAAQAILHVAAMDAPPLRLLLGSDAVFIAEHVLAAQAAQDRQWKELSVSTDFVPPTADDFARLGALLGIGPSKAA